MNRIEVEVQLKDSDAGLTEKSELSRQRMFGDQGPQRLLVDATFTRHPWHLKFCRSRRNFRVQSRA